MCISPTKSRSFPPPTSGERLSAYESYDIEEVASPYEKILCSKGNNLESLKNIASSVQNQGCKGGNMLFNAETGTIVTADMEESGDESASYSETESESDDSDDDPPPAAQKRLIFLLLLQKLYAILSLELGCYCCRNATQTQQKQADDE
uniref:Uncharacterized protein n=1 Tax=Ditylum brightwellii TaxID=49249 RepID=A0A7S4R010_9STRA